MLNEELKESLANHMAHVHYTVTDASARYLETERLRMRGGREGGELEEEGGGREGGGTKGEEQWAPSNREFATHLVEKTVLSGADKPDPF